MQASPRYNSLSEMLNVEYMGSFYGILKISHLFFTLGSFISASSSNVNSNPLVGAAGWVQFISLLGFVVSLVFYLIHVFRLDQNCPIRVPVLFSELLSSVILTVFFLIGGIVAACYVYYKSSFLAYMASTTFFAWACVLLYGADALALFLGWKDSSEGPYIADTDGGAPA